VKFIYDFLKTIELTKSTVLSVQAHDRNTATIEIRKQAKMKA